MVAAVSVAVRLAVDQLLPKVVENNGQPAEFAFTFGALGLILSGTVAGGYLTARLSEQCETRNSMLLGTVVLLMSFLWLRIGAPAWFLGLMIIFAIPSAWVGGCLRIPQKARA